MKKINEITIKSVLLGIVLSMILAGANAYLGLKMGMTVSASIPAAVISMGILSRFKNSNILENNIVQTAASAGDEPVNLILLEEDSKDKTFASELTPT